eukprot:2942711-Rhodomonas_salina.1
MQPPERPGQQARKAAERTEERWLASKKHTAILHIKDPTSRFVTSGPIAKSHRACAHTRISAATARDCAITVPGRRGPSVCVLLQLRLTGVRHPSSAMFGSIIA